MRSFVLPLIVLLSSSLAGCTGSKTAKPSAHATPPAEVMQISDELELATVRLTAQAAQRLGVSVAAVKRMEISNRRPYAGVVVVPPQKQTVLQAPVAGTVRYTGPEPLAVGTAISRGQALFSLAPVQTEQDFAVGPAQRDQMRANRLVLVQSEAAIQGRIDNAKVEVEAAQIAHKRAVSLFESRVGSRRSVDEAMAREELAQRTLVSTQRELKSLDRVEREPETWSPAPLTQSAPMTGTILRALVSSGQSVSAGQPLLEIVDLNHLLVRVRVPQSEVVEIAGTEAAEISVSGRQLTARPAPGPPTADPTMSTFDLYYQLKERAAGLSPDQRVEVILPLKGSGQKLVVPTAAVLYDLHGGAWTYVRKAPRVYQRVRVQVEMSTESGKTVLLEGPDPGTSVVVDGAAEIFGIEFGND